MTSDIRVNDRRAMGLVVFYAMRKTIESFSIDYTPTDREYEDLIIDIICLLPGLGALTTPKSGRLQLFTFPVGRKQNTENSLIADTIMFDIQPIIDSLRIVWRDYTSLMERDDALLS